MTTSLVILNLYFTFSLLRNHKELENINGVQRSILVLGISVTPI